MDERLDPFLQQLSDRMSDLSPEEKERRLAEACDRLERLVAIHLREGADEETALANAIQQYRVEAGMAGDLRPRARLTPFPAPLVTALYCAIAYNGMRWLWTRILHLVLPLDLARIQFLFGEKPSVYVSVVAGIVLLYGVGRKDALRGFFADDSGAGHAVRWTMLNESIYSASIIFALWLWFRFGGSALPTFGPMGDEPPVSLIVATILLATVALCAPFAAGWIVGRKDPRGDFTAIDAVKIAAVTAVALNFVDDFNMMLHQVGQESILVLLAFLLAITVMKALFFLTGVAGAMLSAPKPRREQ